MRAGHHAPPVALLLPGQGSQYARMAAGLYEYDAEFTAAMDEVFRALGDDGPAVRADWLSDRPTVPIDHASRSQILLFAVDYAFGRTLLGHGIRPNALLGHSVGELAAAALAGVFELDQAVEVLWDRIHRVSAAPPGGMLAVAASADRVRPFLSGDVAVGAINAPNQVILAGPVGPLREVAADLRGADFVCRTVPSNVGFHSPMLASVVRETMPVFRDLRVSSPSMTIYSCYSAEPLSHSEVVDPWYWASHPMEAVLFWPALDALLSANAHLLVESGPGQGLISVARRHGSVTSKRSRVLGMSPTRPSGIDVDRKTFETALTALRESVVTSA